MSAKPFQAVSEPSSSLEDIPRFIVGMSRGGTTWMCQSLNEHPQLASFGETGFFSRRFVSPAADGLYHKAHLVQVAAVLRRAKMDSTIGATGPGWMRNIRREDVPEILDRALRSLTPPVSPATTFRAVAREFARAEGKPHWVEKTPNHIIWSERLLTHFPDARIVIMVREPYSFLLSYKHQMDHGSQERQERYRRRYHPLASVLVWKKYMRTTLELEARRPEQVRTIRLDRVRKEPTAVLREVQEFLRVPVCADMQPVPDESNTSFKNTERPREPSPVEIHWLRLVAKNELVAGGFTEKSAPAAWGGLLLSLVQLPLWALRLLGDVRQRAHGSPLRYVWKWIRS